MNYETFGVIAGSLSCLTFLPQVLKTWKAKTAKDVSLSTYIIATISTMLWLIYGFGINSFSLKFTNIIVLILSFIMLYFKITLDKNDKDK